MEPAGSRRKPEEQATIDLTKALDNVQSGPIASIDQAIKNVLAAMAAGNFVTSPQDKLKDLEKQVQLITERFEERSDVSPMEKKRLLAEMQKLLALFKKPDTIDSKALLNDVEIKAAGFLEGAEFVIKDTKASSIEDEQLQNICAAYLKENPPAKGLPTYNHDKPYDFEFMRKPWEPWVTDFDFSRYPKLGPSSVRTILETFPDLSLRSLSKLKENRFCDGELKVKDVPIRINRWFMAEQSAYLKGIYDDFGADSPVIIDQDPKAVQLCVDAALGVYNVQEEKDLELLLKATDCAIALQMQKVIDLCDKAVAGFIRKTSSENHIKLLTQLNEQIGEHINLTLTETRYAFDNSADRVFDALFESKAKKKGCDLKKCYQENISDEELALFLDSAREALEELAPLHILGRCKLVGISLNKYRSSLHSDLVAVRFQAFIEKCVANNPKDVHALYILGMCHQWGVDSRKYVKAKAALETIISQAKHPYRPAALCALAELLVTGGEGVPQDPLRAKSILEDAIHTPPAHPYAYIALARLLRNGAQGLPPEPEKAKQLLAPYEDLTKKEHKEILGYVSDRHFLCLYSFYQRALAGEEFTENTVEAISRGRLSPSIDDPSGTTPYQYVNESGKLCALMIRDILKWPMEPDEAFVTFIPLGQFECYYPLVKELFNRLPQDSQNRIKTKVSIK